MSKRLKRRIKEICGLENISKEERIKRAQQILNDPAEKQALCNRLVGLSHRDIEKVLKDIVTERKSKQQEEYEELLNEVPEKLFPNEVNFKQKSNVKVTSVIDPDEIRGLIEATQRPLEDVVKKLDPAYSTYSFEEVAAILAGNYHPSMFKYRK